MSRHDELPQLEARRSMLLAAGLLLAPRLAAALGPPPAQDFEWRDAARSRSLPLRLRLPEPSAGAPLVLYSHGLGGSRDGGDAWGRAWAAGGIAVLHLQHPGSDNAVLLEGIGALRRAADWRQLLQRVADARFVLDEIGRLARSAVPPWSELDLRRIGFAGHSFGARTTQALAGERFGLGPDLGDDRPAAFIAFSPTGTGESSMQRFAAVRRPFLGVTGSHDGDPFGSFSSGEGRARIFDALPPSDDGRRALLWLQDADHMTFAGNAQRRIAGTGLLRRHAPAAALEPRHHAAVAQLSLWWWRHWLLGDTDAGTALRVQAASAQPLLAAGDRLVLG